MKKIQLPERVQNQKIGGGLELSPIIVNEKYLKKWNAERTHDFVCITHNGGLVSDNLYRTGAFGGKMKDGYFMMLKYTEDFYSDSITKDKSQKRHLDGRWVLIDKHGVEKVHCESVIDSIYHIGGQVYSKGSYYYNIETGDLYCRSSICLQSEEFIFLDNPYDKNERGRGVMKINKSNGTFEIFK